LFSEHFRAKCSEITEFLGRDDYILTASSRYYSFLTANPDMSDWSLTEYVQIVFLKELLSQDQTSLARSVGYTEVSVYTCLGNAVDAWIYSQELSDQQIQKIIDYVENRHSNAEILRNPTRMYNCHSYAWYSQSISNTYWIPSPGAFLSDGVYQPIQWAVGDKVVYFNSEGTATHSGIIVEINGQGLDNIVIVSKWGICGLYRHVLTDCLYYSPTNPSGTTIVAYRCSHPYSQCDYEWSSTALHIKTCNVCDKSFTEQHTLNALGICTACGGRGSDITINNHNTEALVR